MVTDTSVVVDGRRARRELNRLAVLEAMIELFREGEYEPGIAQIAERAGLSSRSIFRYFDDVDELHRAAIAHGLLRAWPLLALDICPEELTAKKVDQLVEARVTLFTAVAPSAKATRIGALRYPLIEAQLSKGRAYLRDQVRRVFAPELRTMGAKRAEAALAAADVLCSFDAVDLLRNDRGFSRSRTAAVLSAALMDLLDPLRERPA